MEEPRDRTAEVKTSSGKFEIARGDICEAFEQDANRLFSARECWYCKYGDFGIFTEHPTQRGVCTYKTTIRAISDSIANRHENGPSIQASQKQGEKTK
ncbi:MAG: hypothetical protein VB078_01205 [Clostridiaceae bacterium]|nr:hypothetical protein [Clostridiaceae bacterium]